MITSYEEFFDVDNMYLMGLYTICLTSVCVYFFKRTVAKIFTYAIKNSLKDKLSDPILNYPIHDNSSPLPYCGITHSSIENANVQNLNQPHISNKIKSGPIIDYRSITNFIPQIDLFTACKLNKPFIAKYILDYCPDLCNISYVDNNGCNALFYAFSNSMGYVIGKLITKYQNYSGLDSKCFDTNWSYDISLFTLMIRTKNKIQNKIIISGLDTYVKHNMCSNEKEKLELIRLLIIHRPHIAKYVIKKYNNTYFRDIFLQKEHILIDCIKANRLYLIRDILNVSHYKKHINIYNKDNTSVLFDILKSKQMINNGQLKISSDKIRHTMINILDHHMDKFNVNCIDKANKSILDISVWTNIGGKGDESICKKILFNTDFVNLLHMDSHNHTILIYCIKAKLFDLFHYIILNYNCEQIIDSQEIIHGNTPLMLLCTNNCPQEIIVSMLKLYHSLCNLELVNHENTTALILACENNYDQVVDYIISNASNTCGLEDFNTEPEYPLITLCKNNMESPSLQILDIHKNTNIINPPNINILNQIYEKSLSYSVKNKMEYTTLEIIGLMPKLSLSIPLPIDKSLHDKCCDVLDNKFIQYPCETGSLYKLQFMLNHNEFDKILLLDEAKFVINKLTEKKNDEVKVYDKDCIICAGVTESTYINYECFHIFFTCDDCRGGFEQLKYCPYCREKFFPRKCYLPK